MVIQRRYRQQAIPTWESSYGNLLTTARPTGFQSCATMVFACLAASSGATLDRAAIGRCSRSYLPVRRYSLSMTVWLICGSLSGSPQRLAGATFQLYDTRPRSGSKTGVTPAARHPPPDEQPFNCPPKFSKDEQRDLKPPPRRGFGGGSGLQLRPQAASRPVTEAIPQSEKGTGCKALLGSGQACNCGRRPQEPSCRAVRRWRV